MEYLFHFMPIVRKRIQLQTFERWQKSVAGNIQLTHT